VSNAERSVAAAERNVANAERKRADEVATAERRRADEVANAERNVAAAERNVAQKAEGMGAARTAMEKMRADLILRTEEVDRMKGRRNCRGLLESIRDDINRKRKMNAKSDKLNTTDAINLLFNIKDTVIGAPFIAFLQKNVEANNLIDSDVIKAGLKRDLFTPVWFSEWN